MCFRNMERRAPTAAGVRRSAIEMLMDERPDARSAIKRRSSSAVHGRLLLNLTLGHHSVDH